MVQWRTIVFARAGRLLVALALGLLLAPAVHALVGEGDITLQGQYWIDESGLATVQQAAAAAPLQRMERQRPFALGAGALWMRFDLPAHDPAHRWLLLLSGAPFINHASLFTQGAAGAWVEQRAGDQVPVSRWPRPNITPLFDVPAQGGAVWLRLDNRPAPTNAFVQLLSEESVQQKNQWTFLLVGGYCGFVLLVLVVGLMQARLYRDRAFLVYCLYVGCMLVFQLAFTGIGGLFLWPDSAAFNDAAPAFFVLVMSASGIWFVREATAVQRYSRGVNRFARDFSAFGFVFAIVYTAVDSQWPYTVLNVYALASVVLSIALCLWTWRRGEKYAGWLFLGFLPVHLGYPFPALRAAGVLPDSWATQYAVLIGTAIEIPLLLWILHWRAKDFSENRARMRALDSTDPLTGLTAPPVLHLRLRDALRRASRTGQRCCVLLVELSNHGEIVDRGGREAGDRALVVAGSRISQVVRDVDTVCRVANTRFAILTEGEQAEDARVALAQHVVARGLETVSQLPPDLTLRFRIVSASAPGGAIELTADSVRDEQRILQRLHEALDRLLEDPKRVVRHLAANGRDAAPSSVAPA